MERLPHELLLNILSFVGKEKVRRTIHAGGMQQQVPGFAIFDAGISVYTTPDWKVFDPSSSSKFGFLGMKCPHSKRGIKHHQIQTDFFRNKRHFYYAQVQGQLAVTGFPWCDFCVYLSDFNWILFDFDYWENELLPKFNNIFFNYALSFIVGQAKRAQSYSRTNEELVLVGAIHNPQGNQMI